MNVIILDMDSRGALVVARSLAEAGACVIGGSHRRDALGFASRVAGRTFIYPAPLADREGFIRRVQQELRGAPDALIVPCSDATAGALHEARKRGLFEANLIVPSVEDYARAIDKKALGLLAKELGLSAPRSFGLDEASRLPSEVFADGLIVKPSVSAVWRGNTGDKRTAVIVRSSDELRAACGVLEEAGAQPLVQERLHGDEYGVSLLASHGEIRALFAHRRIRSVTAWGGASAVRESVALTGEMRRIAESLTRELRWHGLMMIELKKDDAGRLNVIEINARIWGSIALAVAAGVDFPKLLMGLYRTGDARGPERYRVGLRARHLVSDISNLYARGIRALPGFLLSFLTDGDDLWRWTDPMPAIRDIRHLFRKKYGRRRRTAAGRVYLVRHADYHVSGRAQPDDAAQSLTKLGRFQSILLARRIKRLGCDALYASPYRRAQETAEVVARINDLELRTDERLAEFMPSASLTGPDYKEARRRAREERQWAYRDGESFDASIERFVSALRDASEGAVPCIVTHSFIIQNLIRSLTGATEWPVIQNVSLTTLERRGDSFAIVSIGEPPARFERVISALWRRVRRIAG